MKEIFSVITRKTRTKEQFHRPNVNTVTWGENSLRYFGPIVWNELLPEKLKNCDTLEEFKNSIKLWTPVGCPCKLCADQIAGVGRVKLCKCCE